jgi:cytochrome c oxidase cbb3-type subunit 4
VNSLREYFYTDWDAMTALDWIGLIATVVVFLVMIALWIYTFHPSNREGLEAQGRIPISDDHQGAEKHERAR